MVTGRVLRATGADTVPLAGTWVVLHGVTPLGGAPVDSVRADGQGRYRIVAARDTGTAYVTSARYEGIAYFGPSVGPPAPAEHEASPIVVFDTSSTRPPVTLTQRRVAVLQPNPDGSHRVVEYLRLANRGDRTRVSGGDDAPTWSGTISSEPREFQTGPGDVSGEAVAYDGGTLSVYAPVPPGERDLLISYTVPADVRRFTIPTDQPVDAFEILLEDDAAEVEGTVLSYEGLEALSGLSFRSYRGTEIASGTTLVVTLPGSSARGTGWLVWLVVPGGVLAMTAVLVLWLHRAPEVAGGQPAVETPEGLATQIAALDAEYTGREDDAYHARRAELKTRLTDALARGRPSR